MHTIRLPDSLAKEIHSVSQELGYAEEAQFVEDTLKEKVLECRRQLVSSDWFQKKIKKIKENAGQMV